MLDKHQSNITQIIEKTQSIAIKEDSSLEAFDNPVIYSLENYYNTTKKSIQKKHLPQY